MHKNPMRIVSIAFFALILAALVFPLAAQDATATPTPAGPAPTDPVSKAFRAVRDAIEEKHNTDLTYVQNWTFVQTEWKNGGIDSCLDDVAAIDFRPSYFGWDFNIVALNGAKYYARASFDLKAVVVCDKMEESAAPSAGGGTTTGSVTAGGGLKGNFELGGHVSVLDAAANTAMKQAGMTWVKKQLRYSPGMGTGQAAGYLQMAKDNGYKLLLGIVGYPADLSAGGDAYINDYAKFLGDVAALGVDAIEVWNEPNIDREWPAGQVNGANYVKMLKPAYEQIKARNANTLVISGAPAPTGYFGTAGCTAQGCNDDVFMQQMAAAGANNYMDCAGLHYNEGIVGPTQSGGDSRGSYPTYFYGSMTARGWTAFNGKQICYTELGYLSGQGFQQAIPGGFAWASNTTVAQQAEWLAQAATAAAQSGQVRLMIVWNVNFTSLDTWAKGDPMAGYAMIRPDGTCPACATLGKVMGK